MRSLLTRTLAALAFAAVTFAVPQLTLSACGGDTESTGPAMTEDAATAGDPQPAAPLPSDPPDAAALDDTSGTNPAASAAASRVNASPASGSSSQPGLGAGTSAAGGAGAPSSDGR